MKYLSRGVILKHLENNTLLSAKINSATLIKMEELVELC